MLEVLPEIEDQPILGVVLDVLETGEPFRGNEVPVMLGAGDKPEPGYYNVSFTPLLEAGRITGVLHVVIDVTEQVLARRKVEESAKVASQPATELAAANEELGITNTHLTRTNVDLDNFIYTASHDLRAPISNIEGLMRVLVRQLPKESLQPESVRETLAFITHSVERFKRTITNLTAVVKLQKEADQPAVAADVAGITGAVLLDLATQIEESGTQVIVEISPGARVSFSEKNLRSVVFNLLSNTIKYRSPDRSPVVRISCQSSGGYELLTVADNGMGMGLVRGHKLFSMFQRFHTHVEGSGIGLYMVKRMIENAGGKIEVESQPGVGSTFRVYFTRYD